MALEHWLSAPENPQQPWSFTRKEGDVQCVAHVINIAVQEALKLLKAVPSEQLESYRVEQSQAQLPIALVSYALLNFALYNTNTNRFAKKAMLYQLFQSSKLIFTSFGIVVHRKQLWRLKFVLLKCPLKH